MSAPTTDDPRTSRPARVPVAEPPGWLGGVSLRGRRAKEPAPDAPRTTPPPAPSPRARRSPDGRVVVDDRLRARRVEVRRDEGRRRRNRLAVVGTVLALLLVAFGLTRSPMLSVRHLTVQAGAHTTEAAIVRASGVRKGSPLLDVDPGAVAARVRRLPWVRTVTVQRHWPDGLRIAVTERTAVAQVRSGSGWSLVDAGGHVLATQASPATGLVRLVGVRSAAPGATTMGAADALRLSRALPARVRAQVGSVEVDRNGRLALRLTTGRTVVVGSLDELDAKVVAIVTMLDHLAPLSFCTVDVQVPSAPTLTRASACA